MFDTDVNGVSRLTTNFVPDRYEVFLKSETFNWGVSVAPVRKISSTLTPGYCIWVYMVNSYYYIIRKRKQSEATRNKSVWLSIF